MQYVLLKDDAPVFITSDMPYTGTPKLAEIFKDGVKVDYNQVIRQDEMPSLDVAERIAQQLSEIMGRQYVATHNGDEGRRARYGVAVVPSIGDEVSYGFNGDYYPCGKVVRITKSLTIICEDESGAQFRFRRFKKTGGWKREGGTFWLVKGHIAKLNPEF